MDIKKISEIFNDKHFDDYTKMKYKYNEEFDEFLNVLDEYYYKALPIDDFGGNLLVYIDSRIKTSQNAVKLLLRSQSDFYGIKAAEDEIVATSAIESIDFSRESVRKILKGMAPVGDEEERIAGIKKGLEFIADVSNKITKENMYKLYMLTIGDFLDDSDKLREGEYYRNDAVYIVGQGVEHTGLDWRKLPKCMELLFCFINDDSEINDLVKAAIIHFYIAYVHPYFDGNGRMARLVHLWFLIQKGYQSSLFVKFSALIEKSRKAYYDAYSTIEKNKMFTGKIDVTPFITYFNDNVYSKMHKSQTLVNVFEKYDAVMKEGLVTPKEAELWNFVLSFYGENEFSTKQLEKDFGDVAYATVRGFVKKFADYKLLSEKRYGARVKYRAEV